LATSYAPFDYTPAEISYYRKRFPNWLPTTSGMHNRVFTEVLVDLNFQRITKILRDLPNYQKVKYFLMDLLVCDTKEIPDLFWKNLRQANQRVSVFDLRESTMTKSGTNLPVLFSKMNNSLLSFDQSCFFEREKYDQPNGVLYLFLKLLIERNGGDFENFFMDFDPNIHKSFNSSGHFLYKFAAKLLENDPDLLQFFELQNIPFYSPNYGIDNIEAVGKKSEGTLSACYRLGPLSKIGRDFFENDLIPSTLKMCAQKGQMMPKVVLENCQSCHKEDSLFKNGRPYSAKDIEKIAYYISNKAYPKRMPLNKNFYLNEKEQAAFLQYLKEN